MSKIKKIIISVILLFSVAIASLYYYGRTHNINFFDFKYIQSYWKSNDHNTNTNNEQNGTTKDNRDNIEKPKEPEKKGKSLEEKQAVMKADAPTMNAYGLYYDYANMTLPEVIQAYAKEYGIKNSQIAFSYKNLATGELIEMNETQPMTAGSTYKLPLNMLVIDNFEKYNLSMTKRYDITNTYYEYDGEHKTYVKVFKGAMTIPQMQYYSLVHSENTPAYALADRLGGMSEVYKMYSNYGESKAELKNFSTENKTTTNYYIQVLQHLWDNREKYKDIRAYIGESFPGDYYKRYLPNLVIEQKPGYVKEALNVDAIVYEKSPYIIALYTAGLGGATPATEEVNLVGLDQIGQISYVINEWHRVNMNP